MKKMLNIMVILSTAALMTLATSGDAAAFSGLSLTGRQATLPDLPQERDALRQAVAGLIYSKSPTVTVFCIEDSGELTYIVFVPAQNSGHRPASQAQALDYLSAGSLINPAEYKAAKHYSIIDILPEPEIIAALALAGFMFRRRRTRRPFFTGLPVQI